MLKSKSLLKVCILCLLIFVVSFFSRYSLLYNYFVLDDFILVINNSFITNINNLVSVLNPINLFNVLPIRCGARPFTIATLILDFYFNNLNPFGYHFTNLLLHSLNTCLIFLFCYFLKRDNLLFPISSSLFFSLHPIQTEVVSSIGFRADLLLTFFSLISLNFLNLLKFDKLKINKNFIFLCVFVFACFSFFSKENALVLPVIFFLYLLFFYKDVKYLKYSFFIFIFISFCFLFFWIERFPVPLYFSVYPSLPQNINPLSNFINYFYTIINSLFYNIMHILYPINLSVDYIVIFSKYIFLFTIIFIVLFALSLNFIEDKYIKFSILSIIILYLPVSNIVPLVNTIADRYTYYPMIAISILFGLLIFKLQKILNKKILIIFLCLLTITNIFISYTRGLAYNSQYSLYSDAMTKTNNNIRTIYNMAVSYFDNKEYKKSIEMMNKLTTINPMYMRDKVWYIIALSYEKLNNKNEAIKYCQKAFLLNPNDESISKSFVSYFDTPQKALKYLCNNTKKINDKHLASIREYFKK